MSKIDDFVERTLVAVVSRDIGFSAAALALLFYAGLGLALPLALGWSVASLVVANIVGTMLAGVVVLAWLSVQATAAHRRHLVEWTTNLRLLTAEEFEWLVGEVFRREGWKVQERGRQGSPDGNIDLEIVRERQRTIVQCKRWWSTSVGVSEVRELAGSLTREGLDRRAGILVTLRDFTEQARAEARTIGLTLIDGRELYSRVENVRRAERCEVCQEPMVLDRSAHGWWLRCVAAGCKGKRDLGAEPGRAIDLLTRHQ